MHAPTMTQAHDVARFARVSTIAACATGWSANRLGGITDPKPGPRRPRVTSP